MSTAGADGSYRSQGEIAEENAVERRRLWQETSHEIRALHLLAEQFGRNEHAQLILRIVEALQRDPARLLREHPEPPPRFESQLLPAGTLRRLGYTI